MCSGELRSVAVLMAAVDTVVASRIWFRKGCGIKKRKAYLTHSV